MSPRWTIRGVCGAQKRPHDPYCVKRVRTDPNTQRHIGVVRILNFCRCSGMYGAFGRTVDLDLDPIIPDLDDKKWRCVARRIMKTLQGEQLA